MSTIHGAEVAKHNNKNSCWIVLDAQVYDVTSFLSQHPGGASILLKQAGSDATQEFKKYHPLNYVNDLPADSHVGPLNPDTIAQLIQSREQDANPPKESDMNTKIPHLSLCVSASDFERVGLAALPHKSQVYVRSSANSGLSLRKNLDDWGLINFRPRILRDVGMISTKTTMLAQTAELPFYISAMGTMGAIHPSSEPEMVRGAVRRGVHMVVSTASSKSTEQIASSYVEEQTRFKNASPTKLFFQYYIPTDRSKAITLLNTAKKCGFKGIMITVDTPVLGKRTADRELQAEEALSVGLADGDEEEGQGEEKANSTAQWEAGEENAYAPAFGGRAAPGQLSPHTTWSDLRWIREHWSGPIVLKGIQCAADAKLAAEHGCQGILLSNHGGRQLHSAPSSLMTLLEIRTYCPEVFEKLEVYVDGGCRDGADVLKALCLGAKGVGIGRPYLYALAAYGAKGVERCTDVLSEELATGMRLLGITSLDQARPDMVNARRLLNEMWRPDDIPVRSRL